MMDIQYLKQTLLVFGELFDRISSAEQPKGVLNQFSKVEPEFRFGLGR